MSFSNDFHHGNIPFRNILVYNIIQFQHICIMVKMAKNGKMNKNWSYFVKNIVFVS